MSELRKLAEAATPGPWTEEDNSWEVSTVYCENGEVARCYVSADVTDETQTPLEAIKDATAKFIAAANPTAVIGLLDEIDRLKAEAVAADIRIENDALMIAGLTAERDALKAAVEEQRRIIETLNAGIGCETTLKSIRVLNERDELRAALKDRDDKFAALESQKPVALLAQGFVHGAVGVEKLYFPQERQEAIAFCAAAHERGGYPVTEIRPLYAAAGAAPVPEDWRSAVAMAYGHLWHINNEPMAPIPLRSEESASYAARKLLRDLLTTEERGEAINSVRAMLTASPKEPT